MAKEKKEEKVWYKRLEWWLSRAGWPLFAVMLFLNLSHVFINVGSSRKELSNLDNSYKELKESYKEICSNIKSLPLIESKINKEIIPSINHLREILKIPSPSIKELQSIRNELKAKTAQLESVRNDLKVKTTQLESLESNRQKYVESASNIVSVLKEVAKETSGLRSGLSLYADSFMKVQDMVIKSPDTIRKISQDNTLTKIYDDFKGSYYVLSKTDSGLEKTSEAIEDVKFRLESFIKYKDFDSDTITIPPKIESPKKEGPAPIPRN